MPSNLYINTDIRKAKTIHTDFYTNLAYYEAAKEKIFAHTWQFIGNESDLQKQNVIPFTFLEGLLNEPLILTRNNENIIHCLSNVCTHRGNLLAYKPCTSANLRCKYHGRSFDLSGKFLFMPSFKEVEDFPCETDNLVRLPLFKIGDLLFSSLNPLFPAEKYFAEMLARVNWLPLDKMRLFPEYSRKYKVKANWAIYCENYLEGFHIPFVHPDLNNIIDYQHYTTELFPYANLQLGFGKESKDCFELPPDSPDYGQKIAAYYFWVFPNLMFNFYPWGLSLNVVEPKGIEETEVSFFSYVWDESKLEKGAGAELNQVELEDEEVVENVQKGVKSRFYTQGRYSATREQGPHHFHSLLVEFMQSEKK